MKIMIYSNQTNKESTLFNLPADKFMFMLHSSAIKIGNPDDRDPQKNSDFIIEISSKDFELPMENKTIIYNIYNHLRTLNSDNEVRIKILSENNNLLFDSSLLSNLYFNTVTLNDVMYEAIDNHRIYCYIGLMYKEPIYEEEI